MELAAQCERHTHKVILPSHPAPVSFPYRAAYQNTWNNGMLSPDQQYAATVATDPSCQTIMTALLFVVNRPYLVGIVPVRLLRLWQHSSVLRSPRSVA